MIAKIKKLISYYKPYKRDFFLDLFFSFIGTICTSLIPLLVKYLTNEVITLPFDIAIRRSICVAVVVLFLLLIIYFSRRFFKYWGKLYSRKIESDIKIDIFKHLEKLSFEFFDSHKVGKLISLITTDASNLGVMLQESPQMALDIIFKSIFVFVTLFFINKIYGFIILFIFIILIIFICCYVPRIQKVVDESRELIAELVSNAEESLSGIRTTQSFTNEELEIKKFESGCNKYIQNRKTGYRISSIFDSVVAIFIIGLIPIFTVMGIFFVINGSLSVSNLITSMLLIDILIGPLFSVIAITENIQECYAGLNRITNILEVQPKIFDSPNCMVLKDVKGNIKFKNVSFKYATENAILKNLNINIEAGEYVALVGSSGSGKSTICNLIPRFYDTSSGEILIDDINIKDIKLKSLRQNIGFVHQDTFLFSGTIMENILYGKPTATKEEAIDAARKAYAHDFIMQLPENYNTKIGQKGLNLSGGQKQRLAIARVFLKNPKILIFDEATSSLDNESEKYIQKSLETLSNDRTTIVIAHRLSTIKNAKRILVVSKGEIIEEGNHEELISKNGAYYNFCKLL